MRGEIKRKLTKRFGELVSMLHEVYGYIKDLEGEVYALRRQVKQHEDILEDMRNGSTLCSYRSVFPMAPDAGITHGCRLPMGHHDPNHHELVGLCWLPLEELKFLRSKHGEGPRQDSHD